MEKHYFKNCEYIFIIGNLIINSTVAYITKNNYYILRPQSNVVYK